MTFFADFSLVCIEAHLWTNEQIHMKINDPDISQFLSTSFSLSDRCTKNSRTKIENQINIFDFTSRYNHSIDGRREKGAIANVMMARNRIFMN